MRSRSPRSRDDSQSDEFIAEVYAIARFALKISPINEAGISAMEVTEHGIGISKPERSLYLDFTAQLGSAWLSIWQAACLSIYETERAEFAPVSAGMSAAPPPPSQQLVSCAGRVLGLPNIPIAHVEIKLASIAWQWQGIPGLEYQHKIWHLAIREAIETRWGRGRGGLSADVVLAYRYLLGRFRSYKDAYEAERARSDSLRREMQRRSSEDG